MQKDVWPNAKLGLYCKLYHLDSGETVNFDPEFSTPDLSGNALRLRLRNLNNALHFDIGDTGISSTQFQAATFPEPFRDKISVIHDGIDTETVKPNADAVLKISDDLSVTRDDEVSYGSRPPSGKTWKQIYMDEARE